VRLDFAVLISGGKDSALALHRVLKEGHRVKYLVTMIPQRDDSWMFHYPNIRLTALFSEAVGIPLVKSETMGLKDQEVQDLKDLLSTLDVEGIVAGAIASNYQKSQIEALCSELGLKAVFPLWKEDPLNLLKELLREGFEVIFVGVYAYGFSRSWLGRRLDEDAIRELLDLNKRLGISLVGEGGEYESLVLDAPFFKKRISLIRVEEVWKEDSGYLSIHEARLVEKNQR